mmetsp:Transcript_1606/g.2438  ORF Transcript_1606/g.2438 Transcript_1606/m.2438 type:complete len:302 (+) Transcript_1606:44-949(+)
MADKSTRGRVDENILLEPEEDIDESMSLEPEEDTDESMTLEPEEIPNELREDDIVGDDTRFNEAQQEVTGASGEMARIQWPWSNWSRRRVAGNYLGCLSSAIVLTVRLILDREPAAYLIHSIVVFFDMVLIHLFTNCTWLSVSGELTTILCFLGYHFTHETLFELLETIFIAILCSFHLIGSRSKALDRKEEKELEMLALKRQTSILLHQHSIQGEGIGVDLVNIDEERPLSGIDFASSDRWSLSPHDPVEEPLSTHRAKMLVCWRHFFDHFLDGSAGVMYTSFLGLVIDEILRYGNDKVK